MVIKLPKEFTDNPANAQFVALAAEYFITPEELSKRWGITVARLGQLRAARKGPPFVKLGGGAVRYRLSDIAAHERAGDGGPLSIERLKVAVATLPEFTELQRAKILTHMLATLYPDE